MKITWLTQGGFLFENNGKRLVVDPYMSNAAEKQAGFKRLVPFPLTLAELRPDVLLCTHDHLDHLDPEAVPRIAAAYPDCIFAASAQAYRRLREWGIAATRLRIGEPAEWCGFSVLPVFAAHSDPEAIGLIVRAGGKRIYLSGDTLFDARITDNPALRNLDAILICINGRLGNMTWQQAVATVKALRPQTALPMHYGLFAANTEDPQPFIQQCHAAGMASWEMTVGKEFE